MAKKTDKKRKDSAMNTTSEPLYMGGNLDDCLSDLAHAGLFDRRVQIFWAPSYFGEALIERAASLISTVPFCNQINLVYCVAWCDPGPSAVAALVDLVRHPSSEVRRASCYAMGWWMREASDRLLYPPEIIVEILQASESRVFSREEWIEAFDRIDAEWKKVDLQKSPNVEILAGLVSRLEDDDPDVRFAAIWELAWFSGENLRPDIADAVRHAVSDSDPRVHKIATAMLKYNGRGHFTKELTQTEVARWNHDIPSPPSRPLWDSLQSKTDSALEEKEIKRIIEEPFERLGARLNSNDIAIRLIAVDAIRAAERVRPEASHHLFKALRDPCWQVRRKVQSALIDILQERSAVVRPQEGVHHGHKQGSR